MGTVYPTSEASVQKKVFELVDTFNKLIKYPKAKRNQSFEEKVKDFSRNSETLFDIFCYDDKKQSEIEKSCNLKMTESKFKFFEDQKGLTLAKCIKVQEKFSACELRFQRNYKAQFYPPSTSSTYIETMSLSSGSDSEILISETSFVNSMNHQLRNENQIPFKTMSTIFIWPSVATDIAYLTELVLLLQPVF